ncbi:hypothetical protein LCGC14_0384970 [marine sediment metagenome]|uniref:Uncharacterized protein n=1 Tax=marine sediment metagenome TaxID=412755 RepID=A0A0F9T159_9ZZZZ
MKYTVFFEQVNRRNFQVRADNEDEARREAKRLYKKFSELPSSYVQEHWIVDSDGVDK